MIKLPNVKGLVLIGKATMAAHRPEILFGASIASTLGAVVMAAKGGYESGRTIERIEMAEQREMPVKEKIQLTWLNYLPAAGLTGAALGSTTGLHIVHIKEKKQLAAAALMAIDEIKAQANNYVDDIKASVEENIELTDDQRKKMDETLMEKNADRHGGAALVENTDGELEELYLVRDGFSGRDIWSNENRIGDALNTVNAWLAKNGDCELNHFYSVAGFGHIPIGDDVGWSGELIEIKWDTTTRDDGRPVKRFTFLSQPKKGYGDVGS